jgi:hypothetical protein
MKFSDFRTLQKESTIERSLSHAKTGTKIGGRVVVHDQTADPFDLECLDDLVCPVCAEDLVRIPSPRAPRISYYNCGGPQDHRYLRLHRLVSTMEAAREHTAAILEAARKSNVDGMGRPVD